MPTLFLPKTHSSHSLTQCRTSRLVFCLVWAGPGVRQYTSLQAKLDELGRAHLIAEQLREYAGRILVDPQLGLNRSVLLYLGGVGCSVVQAVVQPSGLSGLDELELVDSLEQNADRGAQQLLALG